MSIPFVGLKAETLNACDYSFPALFRPFNSDELAAIGHDPNVRFYEEAIRNLETYGRTYANKPDFLRNELHHINRLICSINCEYEMLYMINHLEAHRQKMILRRMRIGIRRAVRTAKTRQNPDDVDYERGFDSYAVF